MAVAVSPAKRTAQATTPQSLGPDPGAAAAVPEMGAAAAVAEWLLPVLLPVLLLVLPLVGLLSREKVSDRTLMASLVGRRVRQRSGLQAPRAHPPPATLRWCCQRPPHALTGLGMGAAAAVGLVLARMPMAVVASVVVSVAMAVSVSVSVTVAVVVAVAVVAVALTVPTVMGGWGWAWRPLPRLQLSAPVRRPRAQRAVRQ